jgi:hypothetical protein
MVLPLAALPSGWPPPRTTAWQLTPMQDLLKHLDPRLTAVIPRIDDGMTDAILARITSLTRARGRKEVVMTGSRAHFCRRATWHKVRQDLAALPDARE